MLLILLGEEQFMMFRPIIKNKEGKVNPFKLDKDDHASKYQCSDPFYETTPLVLKHLPNEFSNNGVVGNLLFINLLMK